jgi:ABC-type uncharacterized transport system auxiliary subunit
MRLGYAIAVVLLSAAGACVPQAEIPPDRFYRIPLATGELPLGKSRPAQTVVVERPVAEGLLVSRPIVFSEDEGARELREYRYDYWAEPPPVMIRDALVACLERTRFAERVVTDTIRVAADFSVIGNLQRLEHRVATPSKAVVEIKLGIVDNRNDRLVHWSTYFAEAAAADDSVTAAVDAFAGAFSEICWSLATDIAKLAAKPIRK